MTSDGKYTSLDITPTINKNTTEYNAKGSWIDCNNIRFKDGRPQKRGGWREQGVDRAVIGVPREIHSFQELNEQKHYVVGTHLRLEIEQQGVIYDITPIVVSASVSNAISTSSGSDQVLISAAGHGRQIGDYVILTSVSGVSVGGIDLNGNEYPVTSVVDTDSFFIQASSSATATSSNAGGAVKLDFPLESGLQSNGAAFGYGGGSYGSYGVSVCAGWSDPRGGTGIAVGLRQWSLDNWGEDVVACPRGGAIYTWDATTSVETRAVLISAAPSANNVILVAHPRRQLISFGCVPEGETSAIDPLQIRWSDRDDFTKWTSSAGSRAGGFRLTKGNSIIGAVPTKQEILTLTDSAVFTMRPLDNELVYGFDLMSTNAGLIAQHAAIDVDGLVFWCGFNRKFYYYNGKVNNLDCTVEDFFFEDINYDQKEKMFMGVNRRFTEWILLYQSNDSTTGDIDKYIKYNYKESSWDVGLTDRVVWEDTVIYSNPIGINSSGVVYDEETGVDDGSSGMQSYIESSYFDIDEGTEVFLVDKFIPDLVQSGLVSFTVYSKKYPNGPVTQKGPFTITPATQQVNLRLKGRQAKVRFSSSAVGGDWELGRPRYRITPDGER